MSSSTSGYSLPSSHVIVRLVSMVERLRIAKSALLSLKTTGLYSGCMPFFIATFLLSVLEALQFNHEKGEGPKFRTFPGESLAADALYLAQELGVRAGLLEFLDQELDLLAGVQ